MCGETCQRTHSIRSEQTCQCFALFAAVWITKEHLSPLDRYSVHFRHLGWCRFASFRRCDENSPAIATACVGKQPSPALCIENAINLCTVKQCPRRQTSEKGKGRGGRGRSEWNVCDCLPERHERTQSRVCSCFDVSSTENWVRYGRVSSEAHRQMRARTHTHSGANIIMISFQECLLHRNRGLIRLFVHYDTLHNKRKCFSRRLCRRSFTNTRSHIHL